MYRGELTKETSIFHSVTSIPARNSFLIGFENKIQNKEEKTNTPFKSKQVSKQESERIVLKKERIYNEKLSRIPFY